MPLSPKEERHVIIQAALTTAAQQAAQNAAQSLIEAADYIENRKAVERIFAGFHGSGLLTTNAGTGPLHTE